MKNTSMCMSINPAPKAQVINTFNVMTAEVVVGLIILYPTLAEKYKTFLTGRKP